MPEETRHGMLNTLIFCLLPNIRFKVKFKGKKNSIFKKYLLDRLHKLSWMVFLCGLFCQILYHHRAWLFGRVSLRCSFFANIADKFDFEEWKETIEIKLNQCGCG